MSAPTPTKDKTTRHLLLIVFSALGFIGLLIGGCLKQDISLYPLLPTSLLFISLLSFVIYRLNSCSEYQYTLGIAVRPELVEGQID